VIPEKATQLTALVKLLSQIFLLAFIKPKKLKTRKGIVPIIERGSTRTSALGRRVRQ